jgi:hypothetical protein
VSLTRTTQAPRAPPSCGQASVCLMEPVRPRCRECARVRADASLAGRCCRSVFGRFWSTDRTVFRGCRRGLRTH